MSMLTIGTAVPSLPQRRIITPPPLVYPLRDTRIGHWPFDANALDATGGGGDLTELNSPTYTSGIVGNALTLNSAASQRCELAWPHSFAFDAPFECHLLFNRLTTVNCDLIACWTSTGNARGWRIYIASSTVRFHVSIDGTLTGAVQPATAGIENETWYYCYGWWDGENAGIAINGAETVSAFAGPLFAPETSLRIGRGDSGYTNGQIDNVYLFNRILTAEERIFMRNANAGRTLAEVDAYSVGA